jgi:hypothetical protein
MIKCIRALGGQAGAERHSEHDKNERYGASHVHYDDHVSLSSFGPTDGENNRISGHDAGVAGGSNRRARNDRVTILILHLPPTVQGAAAASLRYRGHPEK